MTRKTIIKKGKRKTTVSRRVAKKSAQVATKAVKPKKPTTVKSKRQASVPRKNIIKAVRAAKKRVADRKAAKKST